MAICESVCRGWVDKMAASKMGMGVCLNIAYSHSEDIVKDACEIVESSRKAARSAVNIALVLRNWHLGRRIAEEGYREGSRAEYGTEVMERLADGLKGYGPGFGKKELYKYLKFYRLFPEIVDSLSRQSALLLWTHYRELLRVEDKAARDWYAREAAEQGWSVRTLTRNIGTQYFERLMLSGASNAVRDGAIERTSASQTREFKAREFVKDPYVLDFLGLEAGMELRESQLESALLRNLQMFLLELGKGYAFMGRQFRLQGVSGDYYIDLVFYNVILKCYVLIDLKVGKVTHQDIGQMDMYVRMFDEMRRQKDDNPTIGIVLCSETDEDVARYSVLSGNEQLFASKYKLYLPTDEQLRAEIESEKAKFEREKG